MGFCFVFIRSGYEQNPFFGMGFCSVFIRSGYEQNPFFGMGFYFVLIRTDTAETYVLELVCTKEIQEHSRRKIMSG